MGADFYLKGFILCLLIELKLLNIYLVLVFLNNLSCFFLYNFTCYLIKLTIFSEHSFNIILFLCSIKFLVFTHYLPFFFNFLSNVVNFYLNKNTSLIIISQ